jgi:D-methionine transport system ATP-binding protein
MAEPIIQLKHLTKRFGGGENEVRALEDVSIEVRAGEIFGVIGLSGAGKSTLVRCINLLERPTAGEVIVDGRDMLRLTEKELRSARQSIGMIFQSFNLLMQRTALDNICFPLELAGTPRREAVRRAGELLELVDLAGRAGAYPAQLSGGQKQRVAIARTLATNPRVLLCDEATSALDPKTTRDILRLIQDINKRLGITVVVITHEMKVIEEICARVAILDHGHLAETGTVEEIFASPSSEAGRRLVYPDGVPEEVLSSAAGQDRVIRVAFNGGTSYQPLIATLAIDCGVKANILGADTRNIDGRAFGTMLLGLPREGAGKAMAYIRAQKDITVEEVPDYHG